MSLRIKPLAIIIYDLMGQQVNSSALWFLSPWLIIHYYYYYFAFAICMSCFFYKGWEDNVVCKSHDPRKFWAQRKRKMWSSQENGYQPWNLVVSLQCLQANITLYYFTCTRVPKVVSGTEEVFNKKFDSWIPNCCKWSLGNNSEWGSEVGELRKTALCMSGKK